MEHLGAELKRAREAKGISLKEIAIRTKISVTALEAVERNDFSRLPGGIFGRSFIRAYAMEIGADPDVTVASFVEQLEHAEREAALRGAVRPEITPDDQRFLERQRRALMWLRVAVAVLVIALIAIATWQLRRYYGDDRAGRPDSSATESTGPAAAAPVSAPPVIPGPAVLPPTEPVISEALAPLAPGAGPLPPAAAQTRPPAAPAAAPGAPLVVELTLTGDNRVSVSRDGGAPTAQVYRSGDRPRFDGVREILLEIENAGAAAMTINGRSARALGAAGAPVRIRVTPDNAREWTGN